MYLPDYHTIKFEQQERIDKVAMARTANRLAGDARASRLSGYRSAMVQSATAIANRWRPSRKLNVPGVAGSHS